MKKQERRIRNEISERRIRNVESGMKKEELEMKNQERWIRNEEWRLKNEKSGMKNADSRMRNQEWRFRNSSYLNFAGEWFRLSTVGMRMVDVGGHFVQPPLTDFRTMIILKSTNIKLTITYLFSNRQILQNLTFLYDNLKINLPAPQFNIPRGKMQEFFGKET